MFGRDNNQAVQDSGTSPTVGPANTSYTPADSTQFNGTSTPTTSDGVNLNDIPSVPVISNNPISDAMVSTPEVPVIDEPPTPTTNTSPITKPKSDDVTDLLELKQKALQDLSPLVNQLEQSPEEKFRTTMMMIQASDDKALLPQAYKLAQEIKDEKVKAQSLLDVINEINYFTQN